MNKFQHMVKRLNFFEKLLLLVGIAVTITGFYYINKVYTGEGLLSWALLQAAFLWMVLLFLIILTDSNESIKEELKEVINKHIEETRVVKEVSKQQLEELQEIKTILAGRQQRRK